MRIGGLRVNIEFLCKKLLENLKRWDLFGDISMKGRMILKFVRNKLWSCEVENWIEVAQDRIQA
jgi:hypothetical protein